MANETILIIDDSPDARLLLSLWLKEHGYETVYAVDSIDAITKARRVQPDAILLDLGLPGSSGFLVMARLKAIPTLASIPVIIVSAEEQSLVQAKAMAVGAVAFLQKPVIRHALVSKVEETLVAFRGLTKKSLQGTESAHILHASWPTDDPMPDGKMGVGD